MHVCMYEGYGVDGTGYVGHEMQDNNASVTSYVCYVLGVCQLRLLPLWRLGRLGALVLGVLGVLRVFFSALALRSS